MIKALAQMGCEPFLLHYGGVPGLRLGLAYEHAGIVFSGDMKQGMNLNDVRRRGDSLVFGDGSRWKREECWILAVKKTKPELVRAFNTTGALPVTPVLRPDEKTCPICLNDLSGVLMSCSNQHQVCCSCYGLMSDRVRCPMCRVAYTAEQKAIYDGRDGVRTLVSEEVHYYHNGGNSRLMAYGADCLFLNHLTQTNHGGGGGALGSVRTMLLDALVSWYGDATLNKELGFYDGMLTRQAQHSPYSRSYHAWEGAHDSPSAWDGFVVWVRTPEAMARVRARDFYMGAYREPDFLADLQREYGAQALTTLQEQSETPAMREGLRRVLFWKYRVVGDRDDVAIVRVLEEVVERSKNENVTRRDIMIEIPS